MSTYFAQQDELGAIHEIPAKAVLRAFFPEQGHDPSMECPCNPSTVPDVRRTVIRHNKLEADSPWGAA